MLGRSEVTEGTDRLELLSGGFGALEGQKRCGLSMSLSIDIKYTSTCKGSSHERLVHCHSIRCAQIRSPSKPTPPSHLLQSHSLRSCDLDFAHNSLFARPHIAQILIGSQVFRCMSIQLCFSSSSFINRTRPCRPITSSWSTVTPGRRRFSMSLLARLRKWLVDDDFRIFWFLSVPELIRALDRGRSGCGGASAPSVSK